MQANLSLNADVPHAGLRPKQRAAVLQGVAGARSCRAGLGVPVEQLNRASDPL